jgi:hypothetical protein
MKNLLRIEELAMFLFSIYLFNKLNFSWWWFPTLLLTPDLSMAGYLINTKVGAYLYNIAHHKAVALIVYAIGIYYANITFQLAGIILFAHSSMDRIMGYGLKYNDNFNNTHLGTIGKK